MNMISMAKKALCINALCILFVCCLLLAGCKSAAKSEQPVAEHSMRTVIVSLEHEMSDAEVESLAADYGLNVLYNYSSLNMCALASPKDLSEKQLIELMDRLTGDSRVLSVDRDYIMHADQ